MNRSRRIRSSDFKAELALQPIGGDKTLADWAPQYAAADSALWRCGGMRNARRSHEGFGPLTPDELCIGRTGLRQAA